MVGRTSRAAVERKVRRFLFVLCAISNDVTIEEFEYGSAFNNVGQGKVCSCASFPFLHFPFILSPFLPPSLPEILNFGCGHTAGSAATTSRCLRFAV